MAPIKSMSVKKKNYGDQIYSDATRGTEAEQKMRKDVDEAESSFRDNNPSRNNITQNRELALARQGKSPSLEGKTYANALKKEKDAFQEKYKKGSKTQYMAQK